MYDEYMEEVYGEDYNVQNDWDDDVDCPEVMGPCCLISEKKRLQQLLQN